MVWNVNDWQFKLDDLLIVICPDQFPPFPVSAIVEEQDTGLILGKPEDITYPVEHTSKRLITEMLNVKPVKAGSVVVKRAQPMRLCAVVHDLECEPTWRAQWIEMALVEVFRIVSKRGITSIALPLLGAVHGKYDFRLFLRLLFRLLAKELRSNALQRENHTHCLQRLWLVVPQNLCMEVLQLSKSLCKQSN